MKYSAEGVIKGKEGRKFKIEIEAKSDKHAKELAFVVIGSRERIRKSQIAITKLEKTGK
jgi:ribosomal protein L20A (L18A)